MIIVGGIVVLCILVMVLHREKLLAWAAEETHPPLGHPILKLPPKIAWRAKRIGAAALVLFVAWALWEDPDRKYGRVTADLAQLDAHELEAVTALVEKGRDLESAKFLVAVRIRRLRSERRRLLLNESLHFLRQPLKLDIPQDPDSTRSAP